VGFTCSFLPNGRAGLGVAKRARATRESGRGEKGGKESGFLDKQLEMGRASVSPNLSWDLERGPGRRETRGGKGFVRLLTVLAGKKRKEALRFPWRVGEKKKKKRRSFHITFTKLSGEKTGGGSVIVLSNSLHFPANNAGALP